MGQYYKPINLDTEEWLYTHNYETGMKLMEHSWLMSNFVNTVVHLLTPGNKWHKTRLVWAGDYGEKTLKDFATSDMDKFATELMNSTDNLFNVSEDTFTEIFPAEKVNDPTAWILVNHTKKQYVTLNDLPPGIDDWIIHPLPLLTSDGNGGGGGDYHGANENKCGEWAGDVISAELDVPDGYEKYEPGFKED